MRLFLVSVLGLFGVGLVGVGSASADCAAPRMSFSPHEVDRGGEVTVRGELWGASCYDTGPPPEGEGPLGEPLTGIEIVLAQGEVVLARGEREWLLATVDADSDYRFTATVVIPVDAEPGDARLIARRPETYPYAANPESGLHISAAPPVQPPTTVEGASPGSAPSVTSDPAVTPDPAAGNGSPPGTIGSADTDTDVDAENAQGFAGRWVWAVLVAAAAAAIVGVWLSRTRSTCDRSHRQE